MKKLFAFTAFSLTSSIYALTAEEFGGKFVENFDLQENQSISDFICGIGGCSIDVIENGMKKHNIKLTEEKNQVHNTTKINIEAFDFSDSTSSTAAVVCLSNETCKFFDPENLADANHAYENNEFVNKRSKRSPNRGKLAKEILDWAGRALNTYQIGEIIYENRRHFSRGVVIPCASCGISRIIRIL